MHERNGHVNHCVDNSPTMDSNGNGTLVESDPVADILSVPAVSSIGRRRSVALGNGNGSNGVVSGSGRRMSLATANGNQLTVPGPPTNWTHRGSLARASISARGSSFDDDWTESVVSSFTRSYRFFGPDHSLINRSGRVNEKALGFRRLSSAVSLFLGDGERSIVAANTAVIGDTWRHWRIWRDAETGTAAAGGWQTCY